MAVQAPMPFNRTFMELKLSDSSLRAQTAKAFNRTFMELKQLNVQDMNANKITFNRTFMELKLTITRFEEVERNF